MAWLFPLRVTASALLAAALVSCGSNAAEEEEGGLLFHGEGKLLEGFTFNTGAQPSTGPASVSLRLSGGGVVKVDARGVVSGGALAGKSGTGKIDLDAQVKLDGTLKIDSPIKKSSGDIPGLADVAITIKGSATFDPFLLEGGTADVTADIPETKLPDVPLGSVPGKLRLTVVAGSQLVSKFQATCMTVASGVAQYEGQTVTSGKLVIKGTIVLELPSPLNKEIELPEIEVPIPSATSKVEFASVANTGATDGASGTCSGPIDADAGADGIVDGATDSGTATDSTSPTDSGTVADSTTTDTSVDTGGDTSVDTGGETAVDTAPPTCTGEANEPDDTSDQARVVTAIDDCDGSKKTVTGILSSASDVDVLRFDGEDTFGCSVNAYAIATGSVSLCLKPICTAGTTEFKGCSRGTRNGAECCGKEVEADFNCNGTSKDSARVYVTVFPSGPIAACTSYSVLYHY